MVGICFLTSKTMFDAPLGSQLPLYVQLCSERHHALGWSLGDVFLCDQITDCNEHYCSAQEGVCMDVPMQRFLQCWHPNLWTRSGSHCKMQSFLWLMGCINESFFFV